MVRPSAALSAIEKAQSLASREASRGQLPKMVGRCPIGVGNCLEGYRARASTALGMRFSTPSMVDSPIPIPRLSASD